MKKQSRHTGLWLLAGLCLLAGIAVMSTHFLSPVQITSEPVSLDITPTRQQTSATQTKATDQSMLPTLASFAPGLDLRLRPVVKVAPPPPTPKPATRTPTPPAKPFTAKLTGTIIEPNHSMALFTTQTGEIQFVSLDQMIEDAKVVQINPSEVIIERNGQTLTLQIVDNTSQNSRSMPSNRRPNVYQRRRPLR